jgi:3-oxoadipate enol-lactonase
VSAVPASLRRLRGRTIWVDDQGAGPAVVFVHGLGGTSNVFDAQAAGLAGDYRVVTFDLSGHGMSPSAAATSLADWADDVAAILDDCGIASAVVVAHSLGTLVAQQMAAVHAGRLDGLVLLGPVRNLAPAARQAQRERAGLVRAQGMTAVAHAVSRGATSPRTQAEQPSVTAFVKELLQRQSPEGYAAACEALADSSPPDVSRFDKPVLLVTGSADGVSPADRLGDIASEFSDARSAVIDGIGHWTSLEASQAVSGLLGEFMQRVSERQPVTHPLGGSL